MGIAWIAIVFDSSPINKSCMALLINWNLTPINLLGKLAVLLYARLLNF
jgi:hypothetical protein